MMMMKCSIRTELYARDYISSYIIPSKKGIDPEMLTRPGTISNAFCVSDLMAVTLPPSNLTRAGVVDFCNANIFGNTYITWTDKT